MGGTYDTTMQMNLGIFNGPYACDSCRTNFYSDLKNKAKKDPYAKMQYNIQKEFEEVLKKQ